MEALDFGQFSAWQRGQYDFMSIDNGVFDLGLRSVVVSPLRLQELTLRDVRLNIATWQRESKSLWLGYCFFWVVASCNDYDEISVRFNHVGGFRFLQCLHCGTSMRISMWMALPMPRPSWTDEIERDGLGRAIPNDLTFFSTNTLCDQKAVG